jgi:pilus assembly protein FimV
VLAAAPSAEPAASSYRVRSGDTLTGIASDKRSGSVSLDQMLVALYRGNPQAFVGDNINRLKSGVVLAVPSADTAAAVDGSEARRLIVAQSADFSSFRQKLASAVPLAQADSLARKDVGKVQASVNDGKVAAALTPDKLTLSKAASAPASAAPEARISKDKEKQDAAIRMAELSKNVEDLKKLSGATGVSKDVAASAAAPAQAKPAVPSVPALMPLPDTAASAEDSASQAATAETPASSASLAEAVAVPAAPPKAAAASQPASAVAALADQEPGVLGELLENNLSSLIAGGVALLALLGFGVYRARRPKTDSGETSFLESRLQPDSFFGASGGQRINTREAASGASSSMNYSLSQLDAIGDVDPVAEADVYLAYGRDLQAEEILKEAMRSTPQRMAIRTKLLEVYAKRRDTKGFELLATQLFTLTNGEGEDWATAQAMGLEIDPENPLYQAGGRPALVDSSGLSFEPLGASTMPQAITPAPSTFADSAASSGDELMPLDAPEPEPSDAVDFHLDLDEAEPEPSAGRSSQLSMEPLEFDAQPPVFAPESVAPEPFEVAEIESASATPSAAMPLEFDLSDISLDLDEPANPTAQPIEEAPEVQIDEAIEDVESDPLERKLELAEEFRLIGDVEGARDLLQEIATNAEGAMKAKALAMLEDLG